MYGDTSHAYSGGTSTPSTADTVTTSGCAYELATNSAVVCPFRNVTDCPGMLPDAGLHGVFGMICGITFGDVVMFNDPATFTMQGSICATVVSDTVHVTVAP